MNPVFSNAYAEEEGIFPSWVRFIFTSWANNDISDEELKAALEHLLTNKILDLEKKQSKSATAVSPQVVKTSSNLYDSQKSNITINDSNFFTVAQDAVTGWVKEIKNNRTADLLVKSSLPVIPVIGPLLANLYDNAEGTPEAKNAVILEVLEKYQDLNKDQLTLAFAKLDGNKEAIEKNTYRLDELQADTKEILVIVKGIDVTTKDSNKKIDQLIVLVNELKVGKNTVTTPEMIEAANTVTETYSTSSNLGISELEALAKSYLISDQLKDAIIVYDKILDKDPKNHDALIEKAWALYDIADFDNDGDLHDAKDAFKTVLDHYPQDSEAAEGLGWVYHELGNQSLARDNFEKSFDLDDDNWYAVAGIGWTYLDEGICQKAIDAFNSALDNDPGNEDAVDGLNLKHEYGC